ncbi:MAG TPA: hypothetical protein VFZ61_00850, partial [Polyangiales bacterium]
AVALLVAGCGGRGRAKTPTPDPWAGRGRECVRAFLGKDSPYGELSGQPVEDAVLDQVPNEARRTARAAGLEPLIASALRRAREAHTPLDLVILKQDLGLRLISLETQLAAIIFEAECTGELIEAMNFELDQVQQNRGVILAVGSLVVGAVLATAAGIWDLVGTESKGPAVLGLTAGLGSAALGAAAFVPPASSLRYQHQRNLLIPILHNEDREQLYPTFVFRLLTLPRSSNEDSPRALLIEAWNDLLEENVEADEREQARALLFGEGGEYSAELLDLRERMYDALETQLNALARDLELLDRFLVRELATPAQELFAPAPESAPK